MEFYLSKPVRRSVSKPSGRLNDYYRKFVWEHAAHVDIKPDGRRDFRWHRRNIYKLRDLFTLFVGQPVHMKEVKLAVLGENSNDVAGGESRIPKIFVHLYFNQSFEVDESKIHPGDLILKMQDIDELELVTMIDNWFSKADKLDTVHQLFFGSLQKKRMYDHLRFLSLMQALETYHRVTRPGEYLQSADYSKILATLIPAIPSETPPDLRESLKSRLKYGNEHSLRKRIMSLIEELSENCQNLVTDNIKLFIASIIDTRNYLTHYSDELKAGALQGAELYNSILRLKILIMILFFKELGLEEQKIATILGNNQEIMTGWVSDIVFDTDNTKQRIEAAEDDA